MRASRLVLSAALMLSASAHSQQEPAPIERQSPNAVPTLVVQSRLVPVTVSVTDAQGLPVPGLKASDFEISEDGKVQALRIFDAASAVPLDVVLAIDASESTFDDQKLERMAAEKFVRTLLRPEDRLDLIEFADAVTELVPFTSDVRRIDAGLGKVQQGAATALYDAVYLAADRLRDAPATASPGSPRRRAIVLITDGENTTHRGNYEDSMERVLRAGASVYPLIIVPVEADAGRDTGGEHAMIQMAHDSGGKFFYVADKRDLPPAFAHVSDDLRTQYTLGYYAPDTSRAGVHRIGVRLVNPSLAATDTLRYRTSYYAPAPSRSH